MTRMYSHSISFSALTSQSCETTGLFCGIEEGLGYAEAGNKHMRV